MLDCGPEILCKEKSAPHLHVAHVQSWPIKAKAPRNVMCMPAFQLTCLLSERVHLRILCTPREKLTVIIVCHTYFLASAWLLHSPRITKTLQGPSGFLQRDACGSAWMANISSDCLNHDENRGGVGCLFQEAREGAIFVPEAFERRVWHAERRELSHLKKIKMPKF